MIWFSSLVDNILSNLSEIQKLWHDQFFKDFTSFSNITISDFSWYEFIKYYYFTTIYTIRLKNIDYFKEYVYWIFNTLTRREIPLEYLKKGLIIGNTIIKSHLNANEIEMINRLTEFIESINEISELQETHNSKFENSSLHKELNEYVNLLLKGKRVESMAFITNLINEKSNYERLVLELIEPVQYEIGRLWQLNTISVAQEHLATAINQTAFSLIMYEQIFKGEKVPTNKIITLCTGLELHEFGGRVISDFFTINGWESIFLGGNIPLGESITFIKSEKPNVVAISATMISTVYEIEMLINQIKDLNLNIKVIVGGFAFNQDKELWKIIGADGYASSGPEAIKLVSNLLTGDS